MCMAYREIWGSNCWWPWMIENLELHTNCTSKTNEGEATLWGVKWKANAWNGKKIGCYDLIEIKRATARISRRARRLGVRTCTRLCGVWLISAAVWLKLVEQTLVTPAGGLRPCSPAVLREAVPPTYKNVTPPTAGTFAVSNVNLLIQLCVFAIWSLQREECCLSVSWSMSCLAGCLFWHWSRNEALPVS